MHVKALCIATVFFRFVSINFGQLFSSFMFTYCYMQSQPFGGLTTKMYVLAIHFAFSPEDIKSNSSTCLLKA